MSGTEWKSRFLSATGADSYGFLFGEAIGRGPGGYSFLFAELAAFGYVLELFIVEEKLLSGGEHKILATVYALQHFVLEFHGIPFQPQIHNIATAQISGRAFAHTLRSSPAPMPVPDTTTRQMPGTFDCK